MGLRKTDADAETLRQTARFTIQPVITLVSFGLPRNESTGMLTHSGVFRGSRWG